MQRHRRRVWLVALVTTALITVAGCATTSKDSGKETITWLVNVTSTMTEKVYQKVIDRYEKQHPNVTVKQINAGGQDYGAYLSTLISSGNAPDISGGQSITSAAIAKNFVSLDDQAWAKKAASKVGIGHAGMFGGHIYFVPVAYQVQSVFFYNKTSFAKAGIDAVPTSWAAIDAAAAKLKAAGVVPMASAGDWVPGAQLPMMTYPSILQSTTKWWDQRYDNKVTFANSAWQTNLQRISDWVGKGYIRSDALGLQYADVTAAFAEGSYGMYLMGSFITANIAQAKNPADIGVFAVPEASGTGKADLSVTTAFGFQIPSATKHKQAALDFVGYLATDTTAIADLVCADGDFSDLVTCPSTPAAAAVQALAKDRTKVVVESNGSLPPSAYFNQMVQVTQGAFTGQNGQQMAEALDTWWKSNGTR